MKLHPEAWLLLAGICVIPDGVVGCARRIDRKTVACYVDWTQLVPLHPALRGVSELRSSPPPRVSTPVSGGTAGLQGTLAPALRPYTLSGVDRDQKAGEKKQPVEETRARALEARTAARLQRRTARQLRLDFAALDAERVEIYRQADEKAREAETKLRADAERRLRELDLKLIALETQVGSLAAGPRPEVEAQLRATRQARADVAKTLARRIALARSEAMQEARAKIEEAETERSRRRDVQFQLEATQAARNIRSYQTSVAGLAADIPAMQIPECDNGSAPVARSSTVNTGSSRGSWSGPQLSLSVDARHRMESAVADETKRLARLLAAKRGWRLVENPALGLPDRTTEVKKMLCEFWNVP